MTENKRKHDQSHYGQMSPLHRMIENLGLQYDPDFLLKIVDKMPASVYVKDLQSRHLFANRTDLQLKGVTDLDEVYGETDFAFYREEQARQFLSDEQMVMSTNEALINQEEHFVDGDGNERWLLTAKIPLDDNKGNVIGLIGIGTEFTHYHQQLALLTRITQKIVGSTDYQQAMQEIALGALQLVEAKQAEIYLVERLNTQPRIRLVYAHPDGDIPIGDRISLIEEALVKDTTVKLLNTQLSSNVAAQPVAETTIIAIPMHDKEQVIAVLLITTEADRVFNESHEQVLRTLTEYAAIALQNLLLLNELSLSRFQNATLLQASYSLATTSQADEVLSKLIGGAREATNADWVSVVLLDKDCRVTRFDQDPVLIKSEAAFVRPDGNSASVFRTGKSFVVEDVAHQPRVNPKLVESGYKSIIGFPLSVDDYRIGVLWLHYSNYQPFTAGFIRSMEVYARDGATAYDRTLRSNTLNKMISNIMLLADHKERTLKTIAKMTQELVKCDAVTLFVYDAVRNTLEHPPTLLGVRNEAAATSSDYVRENSIVYKMMNRAERYVVEDVHADLLFSDRRFAIEEEITSCVAIPLLSGQIKAGVMFVNYRRPRVFSPDDLSFMQIFANYAADAIYNTQLYSREQRRVQVMNQLYDAGKAINSSTTLQSTLDAVANYALKLTCDADDPDTFSHIGLVHNGVLSFAAASDEQVFQILCLLPHARIDGEVTSWIAGRAVRLRRTQNVQDVSRDNDYYKLSDKINAQISVPMLIQEQIIGVLSVEHPRVGAFTSEMERALEMLAAQAAIALHNVELKELRNQYVDDVTHQLVGPLSGLRAHCENLLESRLSVERGREVLRTLYEQAGMLQTYAYNFFYHSRESERIFDPEKLRPEDVKSSELIDLLVSCARSFQGRAKANQVYGPSISESTFQDFPSLKIDKPLFEIMILNLCDNAIKYSYEGSKIEIIGQQLLTTKKSQFIQIAVVNEGIGVEAADVERIFERYYRSPAAENHSQIGTGIGLFICRQIALAHGGNIIALPSHQGVNGKVTQFVISLPMKRVEVQ